MKAAILSISIFLDAILIFLGVREEDKPIIFFSILLFIIIFFAIF